ncbi:HaeII family restriction endonuclease [Spirulina major]|uniref:HaeII family restriction endonuclease n=1 Tax=Spirulina major TaxID=270636 RepID=UPI0009329907|nr:HaeII family restriction endonuclease [Spirulina major]
MNIEEAKKYLDKVIDKARVHLYKPIQIAEILYRDRTKKDIDLKDLSTYRTQSRKWRDIVCLDFLGRTSTSSARYQDDVFNDNATPPNVLFLLGEENKRKNGIVEAYIYRKFAQRYSQMSTGVDYCVNHNISNFDVAEFLGLFWHEPGLRRSIDKIYEIVVYSLFSALVEVLDVCVEVSINKSKVDILAEFEDFAKKVMLLSEKEPILKMKARINRVGVTNASDRGLDMWANFGLAIQIKHLSLTEELAENIVSSVSSDRIVIVCKEAERNLIVSILNQIGWKSKIQSIITETDLIAWYEKAMRGKFAKVIGKKVLKHITDEIVVEFPASNNDSILEFINNRGYLSLKDKIWE